MYRIYSENIAIYRNTLFLHRDTPSVWGAPQNFFLVIFIQNGAILGNANGYMCLDIRSQKESRLPIFELRCTVYSVNSLIIVCVGIKSKIRVHHCLRTLCDQSESEGLFGNLTVPSEASRNVLEKFALFLPF